MPAIYLNILALSAIVFLACSFSATPVNALSIDNGLQARHAHIGQAFAKRAPRRCKARSPAPAAGDIPPTTSNNPQPTTTPTPQPPASTPASTPPPASNGNGKAGLAVSFLNMDESVRQIILSNFKTDHVTAIYNWGPHRITGAAEKGYENIPMFWGDKDIADWNSLVHRGYARYALGFNEPEMVRQANLDPWHAAALWKQYMMPLREQGYSLISPAVTSGPSGIEWMRNFLGACENCVDRFAIHWYGLSSQEFINYVQMWYNEFQKPIWVTEFACTDFVGQGVCPDVRAFARTVRGFMDSTWYVEKYFPFDVAYSTGNVNGLNQLLGQDLRPTELAWIYFG